MKKFTVRVTATLDVELSDDLCANVLTDEWRKDFYKFYTPGELAENLAYNHIANHVNSITCLDGFADRKTSDAKFINVEWDTEVE